MEDSEYTDKGKETHPSQEPVSQLPMFRHKGRVYISEGAELPPAICVNCGKPSVKAVRKALRNPFNPFTWIGPKLRVRVGLCKEHNESFNIVRALAFSLLGIGVIILIVGILNHGIPSIVFGLITILLCGLFRSLKPVRSPNTQVEPIEIRGTGGPFSSSIRKSYPKTGKRALARGGNYG
jgi:hypothetical protein